MNYFELHIGDYAAATAHLSLVEDGIYFRLLRRYYMQEGPLVTDKGVVARQVGARTPADLKALSAVLSEFFTLEPDGYHQKRADEDLARFHARKGENDAKRDNEAERKRLYRERRAGLFEQLREVGIVPPFDTPTDELVRLLSHGTDAGQSHGTSRDGTAIASSQTPDTRHQVKKKTAPSGVDFVGVSPQVVADFTAHRKAQRAPITQTGLDAIRREAGKAGLTLEAALAMCCARGWRGFKADWVTEQQARAGPATAAPGKTMQALQALQGMKNELADKRTGNGVSETFLLESGSDSGR